MDLIDVPLMASMIAQIEAKILNVAELKAYQAIKRVPAMAIIMVCNIQKEIETPGTNMTISGIFWPMLFKRILRDQFDAFYESIVEVMEICKYLSCLLF